MSLLIVWEDTQVRVIDNGIESAYPYTSNTLKVIGLSDGDVLLLDVDRQTGSRFAPHVAHNLGCELMLAAQPRR